MAVSAPDPQASAINSVGTAFSSMPGGLNPAQAAAVQGVSKAFNTTTTPQQKAAEPTVLTSANIDEKNQQNTQKASAAAPTGQQLGAEGFVKNADQSFAEAPSDATQSIDENGNTMWKAGSLSYALGPSGGNVSRDPFVQGIYDQFSKLKSQMDATGAAMIENIKASYDSLIGQQKQVNRGAEGEVQSLLTRGGSLQTDSSSGIMQTQVSYGLTKIADLNNQEQSAVLKAQQAVQDNDMQLLDKQLSIADEARKERQATAQKMSDAINTQKIQAQKDSAIGALLSKGITDPSKILSTLKEQGMTNISAKDVAETVSNLSPDAKEVHQMMMEAAKNGAPKSVLQQIGTARTVADAVTATGRYATDPTSTAGQYLAAKDTGYKGTPGDFIAAQKYKEAYAAEAAKNAFVTSPKNQQKLEQEGRNVILKELSNRSGGLGIQDAKVNQAIHLRALFDQYKTVDAKGNVVYNIPSAQYAEVALGLANLVSPGGTTAESDRQAILAKTASGNLNAALQYVTGTPQNGNTQAMIKNLVDSVERQGAVAEQERQTYIGNLQALLPTDLSADRKEALLSASSLNSFINPTPATMSPAQIDTDAFNKIKIWASDPKNASLLNDLNASFPNLSNVELAQKLKLIP